jgi:predicted O-linked N-acetylglucosamine transferase (SPINDLY family)
MATLSEALALAIQHHQAGRWQAAEQIYQRILAVEPDHADALHLSGVLAHQRGASAVAVELIGRAIRLKGNEAVYHNNLGNALKALGRLDEAVASYRRAVELRPDYLLALNNLGVAVKAQGHLDEAVACYRRVLQLQPNYAEAHSNLGVALETLGRLDEAVACYRRAVELKPGYVDAYNNLGAVLKYLRRFDEAVACCRRALELNPSFPEAHVNLGNALKELGRPDEAVACHRRALQLAPGLSAAHLNLGNVFKDQGQLDDAVACYRQAVAQHPADAEAQGNLIYTLLFCPNCDAETIREEYRRWNQRFAEPLAECLPPPPNERSPDRRLRIGYVSPDFRDHVVGRNLLPLLREHERRQFEVFCYAHVLCPDRITKQFQAQADTWRNVVGLSDDALARHIREDRIDILVDTTLHMAGNRLLVFARKPAPVQVTFAGYPGTTGLTAIDYRLTDPYLDPPGLHDEHYAEESVRLAETFWCYDPLGSEVAVNRLPALDRGYVTFGCLNNFCKVNSTVLQRWARVLHAVARSRLVLLAVAGTHRQQTLDRLAQEDVAAERVTFVTPQPRTSYLEQYHGIDLGLDTSPYNGHTTSLDALWMGVPVVTLAGETVVGRAGVSQLSNVGLPELIADRPERYVEIAVALAHDLSRLAELRATLRERMQHSPLMDAPRFARNVEAAYRHMWRQWCSR